VAAASREQAAGVGQINKVMVRVDDVARQNAAACEELSSVATELSAQASSLHETIRFFQLPSDDALRAAAAAAAAIAAVNAVGGAVLPAAAPMPIVPPKSESDAEYRRF
jgi:methyl-accepting chemotaxis protein